MVDLEILPWDSEFFGLKIAQITLTADHLIQPLLKKANDLDVALIYIVSDHVLDENLPGLKFMEEKLFYATDSFFLKGCPNSFCEKKNVVVATNELYDLAICSGHQSRFNRDKNFAKGQFEKLYHTWIARDSAEGKVVVLMEHTTMVGFVSYSFHGTTGKIELIAVANDHQGRSAGTQLLNAVHRVYLETGMTRAEVVTQKTNSAACALYESHGYNVSYRKYIYHYWNSLNRT